MTGDDKPLEFLVPEAHAGQRIDVFLSQSLTRAISRAQVQKLIAGGSVFVNGSLVTKSYHCATDDAVTVMSLASLDTGPLLEPQNIPLSILYEDEYLIAVDKPAGLVVHPGSGNRNGTLVNALLYCSPDLSEGSAPDRPGIVHRLDKETSGVIIVAKTNEAHTALARAFSSREVSKTYYGFCFGKPKEQEGLIDAPIGKSRSNPLKQTIVEGGKPSITGFRVLAYESGISSVCFNPQTGRTHQIRVHSASRGFPIVADELYGGGEGRLMRMEPCDRPFARKVLGCFSRHALHAHTIEFLHPFSRNRVSFTAPFPPDFLKAQSLFKPVVSN